MPRETKDAFGNRVTQGPDTGPGLKPGLNSADTGSVVNTVRGAIKLGRQKVSGNVPGRNSMVSANASRRGRGR